ncbi:unnamed protein product [Rotaria sp. Silwood1]|nr:unnamed protein product [Rotaria sp. Silwood1]CAF1352710.1 unnamed protein product [Rotaria sp. Silwood1]CAF3519284.1 unnamed protein product [Rotaria sp. Silwood1]CAF3537454.1 unnamed protein product [Rotaria sp. Silwood1]CAF3559794.1 unnamed protein product [Rotaria sp. Silwood1]
MIADYRIPQVLSYEGILIYLLTLKTHLKLVYHLVNQINENIPLEKDIDDQGQRLNVATVNGFLWRKRRKNQDIYRPTSYCRN